MENNYYRLTTARANILDNSKINKCPVDSSGTIESQSVLSSLEHCSIEIWVKFNFQQQPLSRIWRKAEI